MMGSFKLKLVAYFVVLALLPLAAAFWGFDSLARRSETRRVDARLEAGLRASLNAYQDELLAAGATATRLARDPKLQRALRAHDAPALRRIPAGPNVRIAISGGAAVGSVPPLSARRDVAVVARGRVLGEVTVWVRLDRALLARVRSRSGLAPGDEIVLLAGRKVLAGPRGVAGLPADIPEQAGVVELGRARWRALASAPLPEPAGASFAVLAPQRAIDSAAGSSDKRILLALFASLLLIGFVAYVLSRSIVRTLARLVEAANAIARGQLRERVPVHGRDEFAQVAQAFNKMAEQLEERLVELDEERSRLRESTGRFGEALAATHDRDQLMRVFVEAAVEATGAYGGVVAGPDGEIARFGDPESGLQQLELPLTAGKRNFGKLVLSGARFDGDESETAASLAAQAVIALDNARLHELVERQALVDELTGLANRRSCEERLAGELARAQRFDEHLAVVMADLDGFKAVNDLHGHPFGDSVLREFAATLRETVRDIDTPARWGGEEFAIVLPGTDAAGGARLAERAREAFEGRTVLAPDGSHLRVTASFGVAAFPDLRDEKLLVAAADAALYEAKRSGKNRVVTAPEAVPR